MAQLQKFTQMKIKCHIIKFQYFNLNRNSSIKSTLKYQYFHCIWMSKEKDQVIMNKRSLNILPLDPKEKETMKAMEKEKEKEE